ncbi:SoxR reducing system RseC family protein [Candidatus Omnitrophota bacterium]
MDAIVEGDGKANKMNKEEGKVIKLENASAIIEVVPHEACTKCCSCRASALRHLTVSGENAQGLAVGDRVELDIDPSVMTRVYIFLYAIPLAAFVATVFALYAFLRSPVLSAFGGLLATVVTYLFVGRYAGKTPNLSVKVTRISLD